MRIYENREKGLQGITHSRDNDDPHIGQNHLNSNEVIDDTHADGNFSPYRNPKRQKDDG